MENLHVIEGCHVCQIAMQQLNPTASTVDILKTTDDKENDTDDDMTT